jgi:DNA-binding MarR family transcriptional regulator
MEVVMNANEQRIEKRQNILNVMAESFVMVPAKLLCEVAEKKISRSAFVLYCYLLFRQGKNQNYWGGIEDMCWGTGLSPAQVSRLLKRLELRGHIKRGKRVATTSRTYCLTRVNGRRTVWRDGLISDTPIDLTSGRKSRKNPIALDTGEPSGSSQVKNLEQQIDTLFSQNTRI